MTNERERLAREWATSTLPKGDAKTMAAIEHIMATTKEPTMADVEWDDEKHYLAGAIDAEGHEVVMIDAERENIRVCYVDEINLVYAPVLESPKNLTPNGKRYELREAGTVKESLIVHPETLTTLEDYEGAPEGTIVASNGKWEVPHMKQNGLWWRSGIACDNEFMARNCHPVLRWGWGE